MVRRLRRRRDRPPDVTKEVLWSVFNDQKARQNGTAKCLCERRQSPLRGNQFEEFAPYGAIAGVFAHTDSERGVWKAPTGIEAVLRGAASLSRRLAYRCGERRVESAWHPLPASHTGCAASRVRGADSARQRSDLLPSGSTFRSDPSSNAVILITRRLRELCLRPRISAALRP